MTPLEITNLIQFIQNNPACSEDKADAMAAIMQLAADSIALQKIQSLTDQSLVREKEKTEPAKEQAGILTFTKKELSRMPKKFRVFFIHDGKPVHYRITSKGLFQARYRRNGYNIEVAAKTYEDMKAKFILCVNNDGLNPSTNLKRSAETIKFKDYANEWLVAKEKTTKPSTYKDYKQQVETYLIPEFGDLKLAQMTRILIQDYLFTFVEAGKNRTAEKLKLTLNCIFKLAEEDFSLKNPVIKIELPYYETKKGSALTKEEERKLVDYCITNKHNATSSAILVLLYFGLRQSELKTLEVKDGVLRCDTSKERKGRDVVPRYIPYTPVLKRVLEYVDFDKAKNTNPRAIASTLNRLFDGAHHPHELRYTFITRCKECGVNPEVVMLWDGHSFDKDVRSSEVDRGYTDYSKEYLFSEAEKVDYDV